MICKDHLVSGEKFEILSHEPGILKTHPVPDELENYYESEEYISHRDSSKSLWDKIYQGVKSHMLSQKAKWIRSEIKQGNILDVGAGTGEFLNKMNSFLWKVEGVEPNRIARDLAILKGLDLKSDLSLIRDSKYDVISLWHVLEHIPDYEKKIDQFYDLLRENGILVIAVPNFNSYDCKYYNHNWAAWDVPRHLWHFSRAGIQQKLSEKGFLLLKEIPLKFDSFYVSLLSEKNMPGNTNLANAFLRGLISNLKAEKDGEYSSIAYFFQKKPK
ncbi:class I SAM-dependent methyltransferase [Christiangramia crocea]|uniref:Class I SAM-dependent methyltransferase n=1 Tax=Christiangramia crocea TaxID=2904124 RepID=A0A9X2A5G5_9FLAO|nr:class I SAM-dependent methyltransferase [Gramella crocea]MCG9971414.1 class I SAM-dependent methyltransferase [Gramella crocea]